MSPLGVLFILLFVLMSASFVATIIFLYKGLYPNYHLLLLIASSALGLICSIFGGLYFRHIFLEDKTNLGFPLGMIGTFLVICLFLFPILKKRKESLYVYINLGLFLLLGVAFLILAVTQSRIMLDNEGALSTSLAVFF